MSRPLKFLLPLLVIGFTAVQALAAVDMFLKFDGLQGESTQPGHAGWIELYSFQWGVGRGVKQGPACLNTNSLVFSRRGRISPQLAQLCSQHGMLPSLTIDIGGERHLLQNVSFLQCSTQKMADGSVSETISLNFTRCATHSGTQLPTELKPQKVLTPGDKVAAVSDSRKNTNYVDKSQPANAILVAFESGAPHPPAVVSLISLQFAGTGHATLMRKAGGSADALGDAFRSRQVIPTLTLTLNDGQKWTFTNVSISGFNGDGKGAETLSLNFTRVQGPPAGFRDPSYKEQ